MPLIQRLGSASARGFGFGKTGAVYQRSVTETATASDLVTWLNTVSSDVSETSTATDQIATLITALNQVTESATAADDVTTLPSYISTIAETAGATDAISSLGDQIVTVNETATGTDAVANIGTFGRTVAETATGVDVTNINQTYDGALTETATGADSPTASRLTSGTIIEVVLGEDEVSRLALANGVVNESASITDAGVGNLLISNLISETATITDSNNGTLNYWASSLIDATTNTTPIRFYAHTKDAAGNIYATGLGDTSSIYNAVLIVKYNNLGVLQWQRMLETVSISESGQDIQLDASGNIYICAIINETSTSNTRYNALIKYDNDGNLLFQSYYQSSPWVYMSPYALVVDATGTNIYTVGRYGYSSSSDLYLIKHDSSGNVSYFKTLATSGYDWGKGILIDGNGDLLVAGSLGVNFSSVNYSIAGITKYDTSGNVLARVAFTNVTASRDSDYLDIALDSSGNIYCVGEIGYSPGAYNWPCIAKYDSSFNLQWIKTLYYPNGGGASYFASIAIDSSDNIFVAGTERNYNPDRLQLARYDTSGNLVWQRYIANTASPAKDFAGLTSVITVDDTSMYVSNYATPSTTSPTASYLLKLPKDGTLTGTYTVGSNTLVYDASSLTEGSVTLSTTSPSVTATSRTATQTAGGATSFTSTATSTTTYL